MSSEKRQPEKITAHSKTEAIVKDDKPPLVSVVIPVRNEQLYLDRCLDSIRKQTYPHDRIEVLIVNGRSFDSTAEIAERFGKESDIQVRILENPAGNTPCGLNIGYKNASGDIFIHFIGHAAMTPDFIEKNVKYLRETGADAVGGLVISSCIENAIIPRAIGFALNSLFSLGGVTARTGTKPQYIDNPSFAAYRKELFERFGYIDERLTRNQDYEFNQRISSQGARIFFTPEIKSYYYNRPSYKSLWNEYFNAAKWRTFMIGRFVRALRPRHLVPPLFVLFLLFSALLSPLVPAVFWSLVVVLSVYFIFALGSSISVCIRKGMEFLPAVFLSYIVIHIAYGLGFLFGFFYFILLGKGKFIEQAEAR